jgi:hypothetical protein
MSRLVLPMEDPAGTPPEQALPPRRAKQGQESILPWTCRPGGLGRRYSASRFARTSLRTKLSRTRLRTAPERSRVHPFAFARLRMAVSERAVLAPDRPSSPGATIGALRWSAVLCGICHPLRARQPIQAVLPKHAAQRHMRMLECTGCFLHTEPIHNCARSEITNGGKRHNFRQAEQLEANVKSAPCRLCSETLTPMLKGKPPANLDTRREWKLGGWSVQADKSNELLGVHCLDGPEAPATLSDKRLATVCHCITCGTIKRRWEELHDLWVRV